MHGWMMSVSGEIVGKSEKCKTGRRYIVCAQRAKFGGYDHFAFGKSFVVSRLATDRKRSLATMPAPAWNTCAHCNQKFSSVAFSKHEKRCKMRADVMAEHDGFLALRKLEGPKPKPQADWPKCTNCGEQYGHMSLHPHMRRCVKLLPHGANGFGPQDHARNPKFMNLYTKAARINVEAKAAPNFAAAAGSAIKTFGRNMNDMLAALGPRIDRQTLVKLHTLFDRFDASPKDGVLSLEEFEVLMRNCYPTRVADAEAAVAEFRIADTDGSGTVDFDEFTRRYLEMREAVDPKYDEACAMFDFFDVDANGTLSPDEFLSLLNQVFPERCEENERRAINEFPEADTDGSGGISFPEFIAYFDVLRNLYEDEPMAPPPALSAAEQAAQDMRETAELLAPLVTCLCGKAFLPSVLPQHQRACEACKSQRGEVTFLEEEYQDPFSSDAPPPARERSRSSVEFGDNGSNSFVPCEWCGRTFFPDRLQVHLKVCKARTDVEQAVSGIRSTYSDGQCTVGLYTALKMGKYTNSGIPLSARGSGSALGYSPQVQSMVEAEETAERIEQQRLAAAAEAARIAAAKAAAEAKAQAEFNERQQMLTKGWVV